ncbi:flavin-containing monooxygenase [Actinoplanes xinjiangensis]|uniref:Putative flavoprotein involved in K+ transport n=1 Tax=Actinoplanes xinjiangensis TaxID=512350 RepID=A0A316F3C3_9ACTN|nr:NAD(P)/FAD-dependent oxidoreductase [Actinoplanes xinjiangensis]PWK39779.1 putative flavoprotein involved in K+ transport [Actinoplanes xinjiangensis]
MTSADLAVIGGGQSGLAAAHLAARRGLRPLVLDASTGPGGSWPSYYDSLTLFSPARFSGLPRMPFPADPDHYPVRDEVVDYLTAYTAALDADIRFGTRAERVTADDGGGGFVITTASGGIVRAPVVIAASGGFGRPFRPALPGLTSFTGRVLHAGEYRSPGGLAGARAVVVGGGNSAVQIAAELARVASVTITTRGPLRFQRQRILGRDFHWWLTRTRLDTSRWGPRLVAGTVPVIDDGRYRAALSAGRPDHRPLPQRFDGDRVVWADGTSERVDVVLLATGYRPDLPYLTGTGAVDAHGVPPHDAGVSTVLPGLGFVGLERQRSFASATLRGVGRDAAFVLDRLLRRAGRHVAAAR